MTLVSLVLFQALRYRPARSRSRKYCAARVPSAVFCKTPESVLDASYTASPTDEGWSASMDVILMILPPLPCAIRPVFLQPPCGTKHAFQIGRDDPLKIFFFHLPHGNRRVNARVVHQNINTAIYRDGKLRRSDNVVRTRSIRFHERRLPSFVRQFPPRRRHQTVRPYPQ